MLVLKKLLQSTWSGFGTTMKELTGTPRDDAVSVFGGVLNSGSSVTANSDATEHNSLLPNITHSIK